MSTTFAKLADMVPRHLMVLAKDWAQAAGEVIGRAESRVRREAHPDLFTALLEQQELDDLQRIDLRTTVGFVNIDSLELALDGRTFPVTPRARDYCRALFPDRTQTGRPRYYAQSVPAVFELYPAPDQAYRWTADMTVDPPKLTDGNQTNIITQRVPDLIEAAALLEGAIWSKKPGDIEVWTRNWAEVLPGVNARLARRRRDETTQRPRETVNRGGI